MGAVGTWTPVFGLSEYLNNIAAGIARLVESAATNDERNHWAREASRFSSLAQLASTHPLRARKAYRPTVAYDPSAFGRPGDYNQGHIRAALIAEGADSTEAAITVADRIIAAFPELDQGAVYELVDRIAQGL